MNETIKQKFVYVDLNGVDGDFLEWKTFPEWKRLLVSHPDLEVGNHIPLWTDSVGNNNKYDPLVCEGEFTFDEQGKRWGFKVNVDEVKSLSETKKFKDYSLQEVLGDDYENLKKNHPDWF